MTQAQAVIETIDKLGGIATLNQINQHIFEIEDCKWGTKTPFASIRRIVQQTKGIYKIKPGLYALETHRKQLEQNGITIQTEKNKNSEEVDGDEIIPILANYLNLNRIAITVMANQGILNWAKENNIETEITPVGDSNVALAMREKDIKIFFISM